MNINILVTGHSGYIGSALMEYLSKESFVNKVIGYDVSNGHDILNFDSLVNVMQSNNIDIVIHLAALSSVSACNEDPTQAIKINGSGTRTILDAMKQTGCKHIIYASTSSVYGNNEDNLPYTEDLTPSPCSSYGSSKMLGEQAIYNHYDLQDNSGNYLIFRMFNVVGTSGFPHIDCKLSAGYDRLFAALESGNIIIYGDDYNTIDKTCERDYVSLKDVCHAYILGIKAIFKSESLRETINICTFNPTSVKDMIFIWNKIAQCIDVQQTGFENCNKLPLVKYTYGPRRIGDPSTVYGSNEKARKLLGWKPKRKIEDIIFDLAMDKKLSNV